MTFHSAIVAIVLGLALSAPVQAQLSASSENGRLPTLTERLKQYGVASTPSALSLALRSSEAEVRGLAANKLAEDKVKDAIPSIEQALDVENDEGTKINIAFALAQLDDRRGTDTLRTSCKNTSLNAGSRLRAARYLLRLNDESCLSAVVKIVQSQSASESDYRAEAISLSADFDRVSKADSKRIGMIVAASLADPEPGVRISASDALVRLGKADAIPALRNAIKVEREESVLLQLNAALQSLQKSSTQQK